MTFRRSLLPPLRPLEDLRQNWKRKTEQMQAEQKNKNKNKNKTVCRLPTNAIICCNFDRVPPTDPRHLSRGDAVRHPAEILLLATLLTYKVSRGIAVDKRRALRAFATELRRDKTKTKWTRSDRLRPQGICISDIVSCSFPTLPWSLHYKKGMKKNLNEKWGVELVGDEDREFFSSFARLHAG